MEYAAPHCWILKKLNLVSKVSTSCFIEPELFGNTIPGQTTEVLLGNATDCTEGLQSYCLVQVGNGIELESVGFQFEAYWWLGMGQRFQNLSSCPCVSKDTDMHKASDYIGHWQLILRILSMW